MNFKIPFLMIVLGMFFFSNFHQHLYSQNFKYDKVEEVEEIPEPEPEPEPEKNRLLNFSIGYFITLNGNDFGFGINFTSPYVLSDVLSFYLDSILFIVDSGILYPEKPINADYILYQIYGTFRLGTQIAYTGEQFRGYGKLGLALILVRDKSWEDYDNVRNNFDTKNSKGPDPMVGLNFMLGFEVLVSKMISLYTEGGLEFLIEGTINPNSARLQASFADSKIREFSFNFLFGSKIYF